MDPDREMNIVLTASSQKKLRCSGCKRSIDFQNSQQSLFFCCTPENGACIRCTRFDSLCCKKKRTFKLDKSILNQKLKTSLSESPELPKLVKRTLVPIISAFSQPHPGKKYEQPSNSLQSSDLNNNKMMLSSPVKRSEPVKLDRQLCMACGQTILNPIDPKEELILCQICKKDNQTYEEHKPKKDPVLHLKPIPISPIVKQQKIKQAQKEIKCIVCEIRMNQNPSSRGPNDHESDVPLCRMCKAQCQKAQLHLSKSKEEQKKMIQSKETKPKINQHQNHSSKRERPEQQKSQNLGQKPFFPQKLNNYQRLNKPRNMISSITASTIIRSKSEDSVDFQKMQYIEEPPETQKLQIQLDFNIPAKKPNSQMANFQKNKISHNEIDIQGEISAGHIQYRLSSCMVCKYSIEFSKGYYFCPNSKQIKSARNQPFKNQQAIADQNISFLCSHCIRNNIIKEKNHNNFRMEQNDLPNQYIMDNGFRLYH